MLALAERESQPIESGCRMGVCGADPVAVLAGGDCLTAPDEDELNTLRRLGFTETTRMACVARIQSGPIKVSLTPEPGNPQRGKVTDFDRSIVSVVVIGNGIADRPYTSREIPIRLYSTWDSLPTTWISHSG